MRRSRGSRRSTGSTRCSCRRCSTRSSARRASSSSGRKGRSRPWWARPCSRSPPPEAARPRSSPPLSPCSSAPVFCSPGSRGSAGWRTTSRALCSWATSTESRSCSSAGSSASSSGVPIDASKPIGQVVDAIQELGDGEQDDRARQRRRARRAAGRSLLHAPAPRRAGRRARVDPRLVGPRSRGPRRGDRRPDPVRPAELRDPEPAGRRRGRPHTGRDRDLPRQLRRRHPHGEELRGKAQPAHPREPGAARVLGHERGGRPHAGLPARRQRVAHHRERRDGREDADRRPRRGRRGRARAPLLHRADAVPPEGRARRRDRLGRDRPRRPRRLARAAARQPLRARDRRSRRSSASSCWGCYKRS